MSSEVPERWSRWLLGDAVQIDWGDTSVTKKSYVDEGYLAYSAAGGDGHLPYYDFDASGVVVSAIGANSGRVFLAEGKWAAIKNTMVVFPKDNVSEIKFFFYLAQQSCFWDVSGGAQPFIGLKKAKAQHILLPPLNEQQRIAEILSSVDTSIQATQAVIKQAERVKRGLMEKLLTGGLGSEAIECGEVPEGWIDSQLGDYVANSTAKWDESMTLPYIGLEHIEQETGQLNGCGESLEVTSAKNLFEPDDVLFGKLRPNLKKYWKAEFEGICSTDILVLRPKRKLSKEFLFVIVQSEKLLSFAINDAVGTKMPRTSWKRLATLEFLFPPFNEQQRIAEILSSVDDFIAKQKTTIEQQTVTKKGLMDDLLTGRVRTV